MGVPKAGAVLSSGKTLFDYVFSAVHGLYLPCVVVGHAEGVDLSGLEDVTVLPDAVQERGPVGALLGLFLSGLAHHYLVVACDQPLLNTGLLKRLLVEFDERPAVFINPYDANISPLPGLYPASLSALTEPLLTQPRASLRELLAQAKARTIPLLHDDWILLRSANTPEEVRDVDQQISNYSK